jgi:hypothetical protein
MRELSRVQRRNAPTCLVTPHTILYMGTPTRADNDLALRFERALGRRCRKLSENDLDAIADR